MVASFVGPHNWHRIIGVDATALHAAWTDPAATHLQAIQIQDTETEPNGSELRSMRTLRRGDCCLVEAGEGEGERPHVAVVTHTFLEDNTAKLKVPPHDQYLDTSVAVLAPLLEASADKCASRTSATTLCTLQVHWMYRQDEVACTPPPNCHWREVMPCN